MSSDAGQSPDGQDEIVSGVDGPSLNSNRPRHENPAQDVKHE